MRNIWLFKLGSVVHIHCGLLSIGRDRRGADTTTGDLGSLQLEALHLRHIVAETAVCNISGNGTGCIGCSCRYRGNRVAIEGCAVSGRNTTEGTSHKASTTAKAHPLTALHNCITDIGIGTESGSKALGKSCGCCTGSGCNTSASSAEHTSCATGCATTNAGDDSSRHKQLHAHTGAGLGYIQSDGTQIAVKLLCCLQVGNSTEQPEEDTSLTGR